MTTAPARRPVAGSSTADPFLHLSEIILDTEGRAVWKDLHNRSLLHHRIQSLFPDGYTPGHRVLYRVERRPQGPVLLVQAGLPVNGNALPRHYAAHIATRDLTPLLDWIEAGRTVHYRIDANPNTPHNRPGQHWPRRTPLSGDDAVHWWVRHAATAGLDALTVTGTGLETVLADRGEGRPLRLPAVRFDGTAQITDPDALHEALAAGIGQGKAFGLGLLSLAPAERR
ncbi:type I-E CRISPR-associated protein Cas6/Cse3/CasE [Kitasatospora cineracea]|uniref:type I-E CRISPR-associated protein Cas6/Cse3/CasE n=1 Tax=Kitasatospora cineracea TaxID=88074 RepID=UPI0036D8A552